ncbi:hypothetical protein DAEQUDRAFT_807568 [Daedalea quercina L-15889]|uniref:DUF7719 domain-containing protein n=1 Tax=Daedalea quercina L-15889 TaxID=1314783 RepID=A0A165U5V2_9APHY|nr:hypothetical protein DAEQUDRAFT_807568 [Daedalea quercina L-15889]
MGNNRRERRRNKAAEEEDVTPDSDNLELTEEEQWRIINETGILKKFPAQPPNARPPDEEEDEGWPLAEEIFNTTVFLIPMSFLLLLMEILVHWQYSRRPTYRALADRMLPGVPILAMFIFYTNRHKRRRWMQFLLFILSVAVGPRLVWLINMASWRVVMQQCPPLATVWVYTVLQLDLGPACLSLVVVGIWFRYSGMKLVLSM